MLELFALAVGGILAVCLLGSIFKVTWFAMSLVLIPIKLIFSLGVMLLLGASLIWFATTLTQWQKGRSQADPI